MAGRSDSELENNDGAKCKAKKDAMPTRNGTQTDVAAKEG
jgi:hypothetical protein